MDGLSSIAAREKCCPHCGRGDRPKLLPIDLYGSAIEINGKRRRYARKHLQILEVLANAYPNNATREELHEALYGFPSSDRAGTCNPLDVQISRLRKLLAIDQAAFYIEGNRHMGYALVMGKKVRTA